MQQLEHPFPPVVDEECRILILGSFPSGKSREDGFFYGHPQNRFWKMLAAICREEIPTDIPEKRTLLLRHHIALWDVIASCEIEGSSDASVRNAVPVDISLITNVAPIERVICNGKLAAKLYHQHLETLVGLPAVAMPSTSPANASCSLEKLIQAWQSALLQ